MGYEDQLNLYAYVGNDPLNKTDPKGLYACEGGKSTCAAIRSYVQQVGQAAAAAAKQDPKSDTAKSLQAVVKFIGKEGEGGPTIKAGNLGRDTNGDYDAKSNTIRLDFGNIGKSVQEGNAYQGAGTVAHEGQHGEDRANGVNPGKSSRRRVEFEQKAYQVGYDTQKALGDPPQNERYYVQKGAINSAKSYCEDYGPCGD